jgi:hypothetical protein
MRGLGESPARKISVAAQVPTTEMSYGDLK